MATHTDVERQSVVDTCHSVKCQHQTVDVIVRVIGLNDHVDLVVVYRIGRNKPNPTTGVQWLYRCLLSVIPHPGCCFTSRTNPLREIVVVGKTVPSVEDGLL
ncbi:hypothetical protein D3C86_1806540 [compost metagenome]